MRTTTTAVVAATLLLAGVAGAQPTGTAEPGYVSLTELSPFGPDGAEIDVDLQGPMVQLIAAAAAQDEPEIAAMLQGIRRIRVLSGEPDPAMGPMRDRIATAASELEAAGWSRIVRVRDEDELVIVLVRPEGERFSGITVMVLDGDDEVALVNIAGDIDPAMISRLMASMDELPDLGDLMEVDE